MRHELGLNSSLVGDLGTYQIETTVEPLQGQVLTKVLREGKIVDVKATEFDRGISQKGLTELVHFSHEAKLSELSLLLKIAREVVAVQRAELHVRTGVAFMRRGLLDEAEHYFRQALDLEHNLVTAHLNLARLQQRRGNWEEARRIFSNSLALAPSYADLHFGLAVCYTELGDVRAAESELEKVLQLNPSFARALFELGLIQMRRTPSVALATLRKAVVFDPLFRADTVRHGLELLEAGRTEEAMKGLLDFRRSFQDEDPLWVTDEFDLLVRFVEPERRPLLVEDYIEAVRSRIAEHPDWADLHNELGKVYLLAIKTYWDRAIAEFKRALIINQDYEAARKNFELAQYELKGFVLFLRGLIR